MPRPTRRELHLTPQQQAIILMVKILSLRARRSAFLLVAALLVGKQGSH